MSFTLLLYIIIIFTLQNVSQSKSIETSFIKDVLQKEFYGRQITAFLCWNKDELLHLTEILFDDNRQISIQNSRLKFFPRYNKIHTNTFLIDLDCRNSYQMLLEANNKKLFGPANKWFLLSKKRRLHTIWFFKNLNIFPDSYVLLGQQISNNYFTLHELYKINHTSPVLTNYIADWTFDTGFMNHTYRTPYNRRKNLMGHVVTVASVITNKNTYKHLEDYREKHVDSMTKANYIITKILLDYINGTRIVQYYDTWGFKNATDKWYNGMMGALQTGKAEIAGTTALINNERLLVVDFLSPTTPSAVEFIFRQPPLSYVSNLFTMPFSRTVWISTFCFVLLATLLIYLATMWERLDQMYNTKTQDDSVLEVIMLSIGAVCQQGSTYEPKSGSGRIITFLVFISLLFIYVSYSAYIVVLLQSSSTQIQTLQDLLDSKLEFGALDIVYNYYYLKAATEPVRQALYQQKMAPLGNKLYMSLEEGVRRLRAGFFAFHGELPPVYTLVSRTFFEAEKCSLQSINFIQASQIWLPVRKHSHYKEIFKIGLRKMDECGIQARELALLYDKKPRCLGSGNSFVSVGLGDVAPAFIFLVAGMAFALFIFVLELLANKYLRSRVKK